jgi:peroxiredoxin
MSARTVRYSSAMNRWARLMLVAAALPAPVYLALDAMRLIPLPLRDRPWPFGLFALACALPALRLPARLRALAIGIAILSSGATALAARARYRLPASSTGAGVGEALPELALSDESGHAVRLRGDDRPLLLVWFRGAWCPYCRRQLASLSAELERVGGAGVRTLAVAPDPPAPLRALKQELKLPFSLISDPERRLVNRCELAHCVAVADAHGIIRWGVVSGNWDKDLPARALIQAAYRIR